MSILRWLAGLRTPFLDQLFQGVTYLGEATLTMAILLCVFWCVDKRWGYRLSMLVMMSTAIMLAIKVAFAVPRPWTVDADFRIVESARAAATGYSFPSGHTVNATVLLGGLALWIRKGWAYGVAACLSLLVAFSRMYLGVHTPFDVGVGLLLGVASLAVAQWLIPIAAEKAWVRRSLWAGMLALGAGSLIFAMAPNGGVARVTEFEDQNVQNAVANFGMIAAFALAALADARYTRFSTRAPLWGQALKYVLGIALVLLTRNLLKGALAPLENRVWATGLREGLTVLLATAIWPMGFGLLAKRCGLENR